MNVHALVGPSGTGKSHRASMVAEQINADSIIDDGLLIVDGRIVAGISAKREATRVAAVKRAIMADEEHALAVREALRRLAPHDLLILGTSKEMIRHILLALELVDQTVDWIRIEQVTSPQERELAQLVRRQQGKHVIPAPTMEVKKSFAGYWVDPLRFMFRGRHRQMVVEKSIVRPTYSSLGKFFIADTVVAAIASHIVRGVAGIARVARTVVQSTPGGLFIEMEVWLATPRHIFSVLEEAQQMVHDIIEEMTAVNVPSIKIHARRVVMEEVPSKE
ncbi:MAG: Asp23/Gls24 family envelope stress response protein [Sulfobacillus sp.]